MFIAILIARQKLRAGGRKCSGVHLSTSDKLFLLVKGLNPTSHDTS
jgi:hypothetical protein